jgi:dihydrofolate reductase (trimethoprim resistance protein)
MIISLIAAMDQNRVIGKNNDIPWRIPRDWEYVNKTTMGHPIILGRKNFESIGRALPGRRNIILTKEKGYSAEGGEVVHSVEETFSSCDNEEKVFVLVVNRFTNCFYLTLKKCILQKFIMNSRGIPIFLKSTSKNG